VPSRLLDALRDGCSVRHHDVVGRRDGRDGGACLPLDELLASRAMALSGGDEAQLDHLMLPMWTDRSHVTDAPAARHA
jgi:hypothetical protein